MPQHANSEHLGEVVAWELPREQFLKSTLGQLTCGHCPGLMHPGTSSVGTQFFAHNPGQAGECPIRYGSRESEEHLFLKSLIATTAIRSCGWTAIEEDTSANDIRPDVLCISPDGKHKVAFEAQVSSSRSLDSAREKTARHDANGIVRTVWVAPRTKKSWNTFLPTTNIERYEGPHKPIVSYETIENGHVHRAERPLDELVVAILTRQIQARNFKQRQTTRRTGLGWQLVSDGLDKWIFETPDEYATYRDKIEHHEETVRRRAARRDSQRAIERAQQLYEQGKTVDVANLCASLILWSSQVPHGVQILGQYHAYMRFGKHNFLIVANQNDPPYSRRLPDDAKKALARHPNWILVDDKLFKDHVTQIKLATRKWPIRRMAFNSALQFLNGEFLLKEDLE